MEDAAALLEAGRYGCSYYISGYAVECALKACIASRMREGEFPPRDAAKYYVHDLTKLLEIAGLSAAHQAQASSSPAFRENWLVVKDWTEESRYERRHPKAAGGLLAAICDPEHGVMQWLKSIW